MIDLGLSITGKGFGPFELGMKSLHLELGTEQAMRIHDRVHAGKTLTNGPMPPSLRAMEQGGVTLVDTGAMIDQSLQPWTVTERKAVVGFGDLIQANKAGWNHYGAKTKNGKWRPRPRPFFGFGPGDKEALQEIVDEHLTAAARKADR